MLHTNPDMLLKRNRFLSHPIVAHYSTIARSMALLFAYHLKGLKNGVNCVLTFLDRCRKTA